MAIRHIIVAAFMASACAAHAGVISSKTSSTSPQSSFLSGWTTSSGASVLGSGALSGMSLIGGIAYGSSADQASSLMTQASSSLGANAQTKLFYTKGIEGTYLLGAGHGILAAMLGNSVSVVGSDDGVIVGTGTAAGFATGSSGSTGADSGIGLQVAQAGTVPEPSSIALMLIGLAGAGALARRRSR
jgi:hypothetical protein